MRRKEEKMKTKIAVAILLVAIFALSSISTIAIRLAKADSSPQTLMLSNAELLSTSFTYEWGPGTLTGKTTNGLGVEFDFTGLTSADTGVGNNWQPSLPGLNPLLGGKGPEYCDFTGYTRYSMLFNNIGIDPVQVCLFMNTGFDGNPNTYWRSDIITIGAGQSAVVTLDFSCCGWASIGGSGVPVQYINQVSNIGFQVYSGSDGKIIVSGLPAPLLYTAPTRIQKAPSDVPTGTFIVSVTLEDFSNLMGFDIELTWSNSLITEASVDYTTALNALWGAGNWFFKVVGSGAGYYELAASSTSAPASSTGASILFTVTFDVAESSNFPLSTPIHFAIVKLSDNATPIPNKIVPTVTDGMYYMSSTAPDLEFTVLKWDKGTSAWVTASAPYQFEYGNTFKVQVYVTDISANSPLQDYDVKISFDPNLASYVSVDFSSGVLGSGTATAGSGVVEVSCTNPTGWSGTTGLLFTLKFQVQFAATANHIWKNINANYMTFQISITNATLSFALGSIGMSGTTPSALTFEVDFIRGDVDCNGVVNIADISSAAYYYGHPVADKPEYDLNNDHVINIYDMVTIATNYGYGMDP
jgi:hypothetical protein